MQELTGQHIGNRRITEAAQLRGQTVGTVTVVAPAHVVVLGQIVGDLRIEQGASVDLQGQVNGTVSNMGLLDLSGQVNGRLDDVSGKAVIRARAEINHVDR